MIPILFEKTAVTFTNNGLGRLADAINCTVTEERNGIYELEMQYPVSGAMFSDITIGRIIVATHDEAGDVQPFDIYRVSQPIDGIVTVSAWHISYRLREIVTAPFEASTCAAAIAAVKTNSVRTNPFTFTTDIVSSVEYKLTMPTAIRSVLGGQENSILDVFGGGEYKFDNFAVSLLDSRGEDTNVSIRYGKNLIDFENEIDYSETYNAVVPFWYAEEYDETTGASKGTLVTLTEKYITAGHTLPNGRIVLTPLDMSSEFESEPTEAELRTAATAKLSQSYGWLPSQNIRVDFVQLWQTEEYKDIAPLQRAKLCDTVLVSVPMYDIVDLRIKVIKVIWNALLDRYDEMELGTPSATFSSVISNDYNTKFDDTQLAINLLYEILVGQLDAKVETWAQSSNPASDWTTQDLRDRHNGDLWLYTGTSEITIGTVTIYPQGVYQYNSATGLWAAYSSTTDNLFDLIDGKTTIYYGTNTGTYPDVREGDYLVDSTNGKTYRWSGTAWVLLLDYKGYTDSAVSGAKVTRTELQYCLSNSNTTFVAYGSWSTTLPTFVSGKYYWMRTVTYYGDGTTSESTPRFYQSGQIAVETNNALQSTNNHFWYDSSGAYVTQANNSYATGYAVRITSSGIIQSYDNYVMSSWTNSGVAFYESGGTGNTSVVIAEFGSTQAKIGKAASFQALIDSNGFSLYSAGTLTGALEQRQNEDSQNILAIRTPELFNVYLDTIGVDEEDVPIPSISAYKNHINLHCGVDCTLAPADEWEGSLLWLDGEGIFDEYDRTLTYAEGDYVVRNENLYKCKADITTPEAWNSSHWTQVTYRKDAFFRCNSNDTTVSFGVGSGGINRGVFDDDNSQWLIYTGTNGNACIPKAVSKRDSDSSSLRITSTGVLCLAASSSRRYKRDIEDIENAESLYDVKVRQFKYREDYLDDTDRLYDKVVPGFIVEELEEVYPIAVNYNKDEMPEDWDERYMLPAMLKLIQDQHKEIEELKARVETLERR